MIAESCSRCGHLRAGDRELVLQAVDGLRRVLDDLVAYSDGPDGRLAWVAYDVTRAPGHRWPAARFASDGPDGMVEYLRSCGHQLTTVLVRQLAASIEWNGVIHPYDRVMMEHFIDEIALVIAEFPPAMWR